MGESVSIKTRQELKYFPHDVAICPDCGDENVFVYNTRHYVSGLRRNRECVACGHRFSTIEVSVDDWKKITESSIFEILFNGGVMK